MPEIQAVQIPGEAQPEPAAQVPEEKSTTKANMAATIKEQAEEIAALKAKLAQGPKKRARSEDSLPDVADIDPATLKRAVLTRQGWLVPEHLYAPPGKK